MGIQLGSAYGKVEIDSSGVKKGVDNAVSSLETLRTKAETVGQSMKRVGGFMTAAFTVPLALAGRSAVKVFVDYEKALNILGSVSHATAEEMKQLTDLAKQLGADLTLPGTSAGDAAEAMAELAKAGLSVNNILAASRGVLQLSAAGQLSNAEAAEVAANALNAFRLSGEEAVRVADLLAAGANSSSAEVREMADSLQMSASVFAVAGMNIEDLVTAISLMANSGIQGSDAGTSLKQMLLSLQAPSEKAAGLMKGLGISVYDASGNMLPMRDIIDIFTRKLGGLTQQQRNAALAIIFGSDAVRAANIVLLGGVGAYDKMFLAVNKTGAAADLAAAMMKGLTGAMENVKSAFETAAIAAIEPFKDDLATLLGFVAKALNAFAALPESVRKFIVIALFLLAVMGPLLVVLGTVLPMVVGHATRSFNPLSGGIIGLIFNFAKLVAAATLIVKILTFLGISTGPVGAGILALNATIVGAAGSMAAAIWAVAWPILLLVGAAALVYWAFKTNFMGITTTLQQAAFIVDVWVNETSMAFTKWVDDTSMAFTKWVDDTSMAFTKWVDDTSMKFTQWVDENKSKFSKFADTVKAKFAGVGTTASQLWFIIKNAFSGIGVAIDWVIAKINNLKTALLNIKLPPALTPGSPTPFEKGLDGIAGAMGKVAEASRKMASSIREAGKENRENIGTALKTQLEFFNSYFKKLDELMKDNTKNQDAAMKAQAKATEQSLKAQAEAMKKYLAAASKFWGDKGLPTSGGKRGTPGSPDFSNIPPFSEPPNFSGIPVETIGEINVEQILNAMAKSMVDPNIIARAMAKPTQNNNSQSSSIVQHFSSGLTLRDVDALMDEKINRFVKRAMGGA